MKKNKLRKIKIVLFFIIIITIGVIYNIENQNTENNIINNNQNAYEITNIPSYSSEKYTEINNNIPKFSDEDINIVEDYYSNLENGRVRTSNSEN